MCGLVSRKILSIIPNQLSIIPNRKLEVIVPVEDSLWGFGDFDDLEGGLFCSFLVLDGHPDDTYAHCENGEELGKIDN